jgi:hypothetical protein
VSCPRSSRRRASPLRLFLFGAAATAALVILWPLGGHYAAAQGGGSPPFPPPPTSITSALATVPADFAGVEQQRNFELYSWLTFIALNWPAQANTCEPDLNRSVLDGARPTVWEKYLEDSDVFVAPGKKPSAWCPPGPTERMQALLAKLPPAARAEGDRLGVRCLLTRQSKASRSLIERFPGIEEAVGGVLTDQNGRFVRYEIRINQDEYNFLVDPKNNLWSQAGQKAFAGPVKFPQGPSAYGPVGAMEIKAAWKVLSSQEIAGGRYYTELAYVYNDDQETPSPGPNPVTVGLVGLHIIHKTRLQPLWIWSTFEHVDNTTSAFYNPNCPPSQCPPDVQTASRPYRELSAQGTPLNKPVQVVRLQPIIEDAAQMNVVFQKLLQGSVWANYQVIATQWVGELGNLPKPAFLGNTTLETYIQGPVPPTDGPVAYPNPGYDPFHTGVTASCLKCHSVAPTTAGQPADFSFLLGEAQ